MADRKLISPKFRAIIGDMELSDGITAECYSSVTERCNYATIELNKRLIGSVERVGQDACRSPAWLCR